MYTSKLAVTLLLAAIALPAMAEEPAKNTPMQWKAYVCKATDWVDCQQDKNNKRIYPSDKRYPDQDSCLYDFEGLFDNDPEISSKFKMTNDIESSYLFDCVSEKKPI